MYWQPKPWHSISQFCLFCVLMAILGGTNFEGILPTTHCSLPELMDGAHRNRDGKWKVDVKPIPFLSWSKPPFNLCHNTCKRLLFYMVVLSFSVFRWGSRGCEIPCSCHCFYQIAHRTQRLEWLVRELPVSFWPCLLPQRRAVLALVKPMTLHFKTIPPHTPPFWNTHVPLQSTTMWKSPMLTLLSFRL